MLTCCVMFVCLKLAGEASPRVRFSCAQWGDVRATHRQVAQSLLELGLARVAELAPGSPEELANLAEARLWVGLDDARAARLAEVHVRGGGALRLVLLVLLVGLAHLERERRGARRKIALLTCPMPGNTPSPLASEAQKAD